MERATVSCNPSLVMVRERELSTGGTILGKGLCSKGSVNGMEVLAVLGTRLCMGSLFIVCHTSLYHTIRCGGIGLYSAPSARGSNW